MRKLFEAIVRHRNPVFHVDDSLSATEIFRFGLLQGRNLLRGCRMCWRLRNPRWMMRGNGVRFVFASRIHWGAWLKLGERVVLNGCGKRGIVLGDRVSIGAYSRLVASTTLDHVGEGIRIGHRVGIGEFAYLGGAGGLSIGDDCIIGQYFSCHPENHRCEDTSRPIRLQGVRREGIRIGRNCWIGSKVTILDGVVVGDGCVIAAGAVVTKSFPDNSVIGGVPARLLKCRNQTVSA
jgi:acetyltransferase-like isoleucine patch superfamily enzyme